jgi:hypothetical protein
VSNTSVRLGYLYLVEDEFIPQAVVPNDTAAKLCFFPLGGKVQQPPLHCGVCLCKNLMRQEVRIGWLQESHVITSVGEK